MRTTVLVGAVIIVSIVIAGILSLNYVFTSNPHVEITSFNTTGTSSGSSPDVVYVWFFLNLTNTGTSDVKELIITFSTNTTVEGSRRFIYTNSAPPYDPIAEFKMGEPWLLGGLKAGETKDFRFYWDASVDFNATTLYATLKSNEAILDQAILTIPPIPNVKIINLVYLGNWHGTTLGGLLDLFSLSYTNLGIADAEDLTVTLNTSKTNSKDTDSQHPTPTPIPGYNPYYLLDEIINGETHSLGSLKAGETKAFEKSYLDVGFLLVEPFALTVTLKSNDIIIDETTIIIPLTYFSNQ